MHAGEIDFRCSRAPPCGDGRSSVTLKFSANNSEYISNPDAHRIRRRSAAPEAKIREEELVAGIARRCQFCHILAVLAPSGQSFIELAERSGTLGVRPLSTLTVQWSM